MYTLSQWPTAPRRFCRLLAVEDTGTSLQEEAQHPPELDRERQALAKRYARQRQRLSLISLGISAVMILVLLVFGLGFGLRNALSETGNWQPVAGWSPLLVAAYFLVLYAVVFVLGLPFTYYGGYILPHRYGQSTQSLRAFAVDTAKGVALAVAFELAAVEFIYLLLAVAPSTWWLWTGLAMLLVTVLLANLAPVIFLPLFFKLTPLPEGKVKERALALAAQAGTRVRGIYSMNMSSKTTAANAMVIGLGNTRRIVIGDTLLDRYTEDEIAFVIAHELGHQVHWDIPKLILVETLTTLGGLALVNWVLHVVVGQVSLYHGLADPATMPLVAATLGAFALVLLPVTNGFSRIVEHQADVYALESTRDPQAFIAAMTRLANQNLAELEPPRIVEFMLHNHPSVGRRLAYARANEARFQ
ncbi:MAG: M48 family metallopeptidase [Ktedonobacterales bacterium]